MVDFQGYTTHTHDIPIEVFLAFIQDDIKNVIRTHGHKNCGLKYEDVCEKIQKIITTKKTHISKFLDNHGRDKLNSEWRREKNGFLNKLFEEEGFINMCSSKKYKNDPSLNQLLSKHIKFCKEKDDRLSALRKKREFSECVNYNSWIEKERKSFHQEYLNNVRDFKAPTVNKYFSTKEHPQGHDPVRTYLNSKLDCNRYNPPTRSHPKGSLEKAPKSSIHLPTSPDVGQKSQGKGEKSMPDRAGGIQKKQSDAMIPPQTEPPVSDTQTSSPSNAKVDDTDNDQNADLKAKGSVSPNNTQDATGQSIETTDTKAQSPQKLSKPPNSTSPKDSSVAKDLDPRPPVIKDQGALSDSSPSTTSATSPTTHSTQKVSSPSDPDLSLPQSQTPAVAAVPSQHQIPVTAQNSKETTPPDSAGKSTDQDASLNSALDPGLAPPQAAASNSSASETSSTTTISTIGSSLDKDSHLSTPSTQPVVTTSIDTTLIQTTASVSGPPKITVSAMSTNTVPSITGSKSTTGGSGEPNTPLTTIPDSQDPNSASPKNQNDALTPDTGTNFSDTSSSPTIANSNINLLPDPSSSPPHLHLSIPYPGLSSGVSPVGLLPVHFSTSTVVTKQADDKKITAPKDAPQQYKDITQVSSMSLPKGTQSNDKPSIIPTIFPPLTSIIPTIYTPFGFLLGRRRKRKKRDLRSEFVIPEESTYESPNITVHELEGPNLLEQTVKSEEYVKLLKINRYKQEMQKRKKENKKTLIEVHMEVLEEYKNDEWELHKGDFLEICLRGFINDENDFYSNFSNSKLIANNIKNEETIEDIQKHKILWNNWIEDHRNILEQWKNEDWFQILKNKWRKEQQIYKEKNNKLQENILNEEEKHSIVNQKDIWKQWISKQATLIDMFNKEDWFKSMVYTQNKEKINYHINEYNDISVTSKIGLKNEKTNHEEDRSKNIIQKLMVQIHMMVLEECIKEEMIKQKELCLDNFIEDIHNQNNYDEKRNIAQCDTDDFNILKYEEIHTSTNK
ncbi:STP1 protein [Plasmodium ovale wallikeri]|uniref:STP1 protein n=1 Tax=Plasmodium ovale wallikeri TaxID=864142 RepID=A0A1A9AIC5_PLAOA|nr:STP1 protein [Plasmodium ovale wallikeri]